MSDFVARNSDFRPSRAAERVSKTVGEIQASGGAGSSRDGGSRHSPDRPIPASDADVEQKLSSAIEVAQAQARVADLLSNLAARHDAAINVDAVEAQISALMPKPTVIVPLPPVSRVTVEMAVQTAQAMQASAALAISAQANVKTAVAAGILA